RPAVAGPLDSLVVENVDTEQLWAQVSLQNESMHRYLRTALQRCATEAASIADNDSEDNRQTASSSADVIDGESASATGSSLHDASSASGQYGGDDDSHDGSASDDDGVNDDDDD